jgi:hypothetical protein
LSLAPPRPMNYSINDLHKRGMAGAACDGQ